ncbi:MAG: hypothetical protein ACR2JV_05510 [Gaiellales bacterium]
MKLPLSRRVAAIVGIVAVFAVIVTAAFAADLSQNATSLPSKNPTDLKASNGKAWTQQLAGASYVGRTTALVDEWGNATTTGGGTLTIGKQTTVNDDGFVTITIKSLDSGLVISNAMVTASGGQVQAVQIMSTTLSKNGMTYAIKLKLPGEQGTPPLLSIKWYTEQLMM